MKPYARATLLEGVIDTFFRRYEPRRRYSDPPRRGPGQLRSAAPTSPANPTISTTPHVRLMPCKRPPSRGSSLLKPHPLYPLETLLRIGGDASANHEFDDVIKAFYLADVHGCHGLSISQDVDPVCNLEDLLKAVEI